MPSSFAEVANLAALAGATLLALALLVPAALVVVSAAAQAARRGTLAGTLATAALGAVVLGALGAWVRLVGEVRLWP